MSEKKKGEKNNKERQDSKISDETVVFKPITEEQLKKAKKNKKNKAKGKHHGIKKFFKVLLILLLILIIIGIAVVVAIFKTDRWAIDKEQFMSDKGATIYDKDGNDLIKLTGDEINKKLELSEMGHLPDAFVSIEDERFYEHNGVDIKRTLHAIFKYIVTGGKSNFGGSTITQQLVKITMKDDERSGFAAVQRKVREWSRARNLEKMLTKDEILQRYLNRIYLGSASGLEIRGVESAANYYFSKSAKDLSVAEAAFIAGINHSPNNYNVFTASTDISSKVRKRSLTVVSKMYELGKISKEEYDAANDEINNGLKFAQGNVSNGKSELSYHATAAINQIANEISERDDIKYSEAREMLINSGYNIYTTVDQSVQSKMETVMENPKYILTGTNPKKKSEDHKGQSAMVVIEPSTGYVVGEVGGLGTDQDPLGLNRGTSKRQAGSSFKPLATIAPGLETGTITAATLFYDVTTTFGKNYTVNGSHGIENMRTILTKSCNVPEIKLLSIMGQDKSTAFLESIGIDASKSDAGLSMALGTIDVSPVQMAAGFAMIANGGTYIEPTFYTKVTDASGKTIIEATQDKKRVMSEDNAYIEEDLLTGPVKNGTAKSFNGYLGKMDVAGKTGTTNDNIDRWFCGMTPYYAAACWYGNDNNNGQFASRNPAATVWFDCMKSIHKDLETKSFNKPDGIETVTICRATGKKATDKCKDTYSEIFAKDHIPEDCDGHTSVKICKESRKIATEYCPDTETKAFGVLIDTEKDAKWSPAQKVEKAPTETCDIHTSAPEVDVPNVVGKNEDEAKKALTSAGFKVEVAKDQDPSKTKGIVLKQSATKSAKGGTITITVNQYDGSSSNDKKVIKTPDEDETDDDEKDNKDSKNSNTNNKNTTTTPPKSTTGKNVTE